MRILSLFFILFLASFLIAGCTERVEWNVYVIGESVREYTFEELNNVEMTVIYETVVEKEIKKVGWEGGLVRNLGEGDVINFISEDGYMVSIPYGVDVILAVKKEGDLIGKEDGGPVKVVVDPEYGCKCNWLKFVRVVEFVDEEKSFSVYGEVFNLLTFSPRAVNLYYGLKDVVNNTYREAPLTFFLDKAICKQNAATIVFITETGRISYSLEEIRAKNVTVRYENGFFIDELGIWGLKGIRIE